MLENRQPEGDGEESESENRIVLERELMGEFRIISRLK